MKYLKLNCLELVCPEHLGIKTFCLHDKVN